MAFDKGADEIEAFHHGKARINLALNPAFIRIGDRQDQNFCGGKAFGVTLATWVGYQSDTTATRDNGVSKSAGWKHMTASATSSNNNKGTHF
jgi:hypothetical protein